MASLYIWFDACSVTALRRFLRLEMKERTLLCAGFEEHYACRPVNQSSLERQAAIMCEDVRCNGSGNIVINRFLRQWKLWGKRGKAKNLISTLRTLQLCVTDWYPHSPLHE
jgi:hypothetical protein